MNLHFLTHEFARANKRHTTYPSLRHLLELRHCLSVQIEMLQHLVPLMGPMSRTHLPSAGQPVQGQINIPLEAPYVSRISQSARDQCLMLSQCWYESFRVWSLFSADSTFNLMILSTLIQLRIQPFRSYNYKYRTNISKLQPYVW